jgi:hypothetical protein
MPDMYQADDLTRATLVLGLEGLPTAPLHRRQAELRPERNEPDGGGDDTDPLPTSPEPDGGIL